MNQEKPSVKRKFSQDILFRIKYPTWGVPSALSPNGEWLAVTLQSPANFKLADHIFTKDGIDRCTPGSSLVILNTATGEAINPFPQGSTSWAPNWSDDGSMLAAYVQHEGHTCLGVWNREDSSCKIFSHITVKPYVGFDPARWTPDGRIVMKTHRLTPKPEDELSVRVYHNHECGQASSGKLLQHWISDLSLVDVATGEPVTLVSDWAFTTWKVSPDGKSVAVCRKCRYDSVKFDDYCELVVIPIDGSDIQVVTEVFNANEWANGFSWSPNGQWLAYATGGRDERGRIFVVPSDGSTPPHDLTEDMDENFSDPFRAPCWSADSQRIIRQLGRDIWTLSVDGKSRQKTTPEIGESTRFSFTVSAINRDLLVLDEKAVSLYFSDTKTGQDGVALVDLATGNIGSTVYFPEELNSVDGGMERCASYDGRICYDFLESPTHTPQL